MTIPSSPRQEINNICSLNCRACNRCRACRQGCDLNNTYLLFGGRGRNRSWPDHEAEPARGNVTGINSMNIGLGLASLGPMLGALGLKIALVEDEEAFARIRPRLAQREVARVREPASATAPPG